MIAGYTWDVSPEEVSEPRRPTGALATWRRLPVMPIAHEVALSDRDFAHAVDVLRDFVRFQ